MESCQSAMIATGNESMADDNSDSPKQNREMDASEQRKDETTKNGSCTSESDHITENETDKDDQRAVENNEAKKTDDSDESVKWGDDSSMDDSSSDSSDDAVYFATIPAPRIPPNTYTSMYVLHTIIEESCEDSDDRDSDYESRRKKTDLEEYFSFALQKELEKKAAKEDLASKGSDSTGCDLSRYETEVALLASSRLEKYFTSGLLGSAEICYPDDVVYSEDVPDNGWFEKCSRSQTSSKLQLAEGDDEGHELDWLYNQSDTPKRGNNVEHVSNCGEDDLDMALFDVRCLFDGDADECVTMDVSKGHTIDSLSDDDTVYIVNKLMMHINTVNADSQKFNETIPTFNMLETQISQLMQSVSPAVVDSHSSSSTCSSTIGSSVCNSSDCGSDTLESREDSTDEDDAFLEKEMLKLSTKRKVLSRDSHSCTTIKSGGSTDSTVSEETIYFCKQLVESLKRMSENADNDHQKLTPEEEMSEAREYIKDQIEALMHTVTTSYQNSPRGPRSRKTNHAEHCTTSESEALDSSDIESPRPPCKSNKTPSESGSETTISASISIPSYDDSDNTATESEMSHEMEELFVLLEGGSNRNLPEFLPKPKLRSFEDKQSGIKVNLKCSNKQQSLEEKRRQITCNLDRHPCSLGLKKELAPLLTKCMNLDIADFNAVVQSSLESGKVNFFAPDLRKVSEDEVIPDILRLNISQKSEITDPVVIQCMQTENIHGEDGKGSRSSNEQLQQHGGSLSEFDDKYEVDADSGVGTPVPKAFINSSLNSSKEKASSENNLLVANYKTAVKTTKVVGTKSASNITELESSGSKSSCRDTGYYSFKSSEESVRSFDDSAASRASSMSLTQHKSLTSTETIPEVEEEPCGPSPKLSLSSGNIPHTVLSSTSKSSTLPLNLRSKVVISPPRSRPFSSSFFSTSGVLRKLTALRDDHAAVHRSSPRGRLRTRGKSLSGSGDDLKGSSGSMPQIFISDCVENSNSTSRDSASLSEKESVSVSEDDIDQAFNSHHTKSKTSLFGTRSESLSSVYSAAGGGRYGAVVVSGEILFGTLYNHKDGYFNLHIKECRNLAAVDAKRNRSDPYVKVYLLPDKTKSGKRKTKVKKHCLNPLFDEVLKFHVTSGELESRTMWLSVWHSDIFGRNDFLGEVMLPLTTELFENSALKWYPLQERMDTLESPLCYKGDMVLALKYVPPDVTVQKPHKKVSSSTKGSLHVLVKQARNLMATRSNGTSDPFCKSYLLPDKSKSGKQKTQVIKKSCNPRWNHTFVYEDVTVQDLHDRCLELTIWDYDKITSNDFLGGIRLGLGTGKYHNRDVDWMDSVGEEVVLWRSMLDQPNMWIEGSLLLRPTISRRS